MRTFVSLWVCLGLLPHTTGLSRIPLARPLPRGLQRDDSDGGPDHHGNAELLWRFRHEDRAVSYGLGRQVA